MVAFLGKPDPRRPMSEQLTELLRKATHGDLGAEERLYDLVQKELLQLAQQERRGWDGNLTLDTVALVSSAFIRVRGADISWDSRRHFFAVTRKAMRQSLFTYAEAQGRQRRGGGAPHTELDEALAMTESEADAILELRRALVELREVDARSAEIVELRYFVGLKNREIGELLELGESTVRRKLRAARGYLRDVMGSAGDVLGGEFAV